MPYHVKDSGVWKEGQAQWIKDGGVWKEVQEGSIKDGGIWKPYHTAETWLLLVDWESGIPTDWDSDNASTTTSHSLAEGGEVLRLQGVWAGPSF